MTVSECQYALRDAGKSYPRTCAKCGLSGLCKDGLSREQLLAKLAALDPAPDPRDAVIAQLVEAAADVWGPIWRLILREESCIDNPCDDKECECRAYLSRITKELQSAITAAKGLLPAKGSTE